MDPVIEIGCIDDALMNLEGQAHYLKDNSEIRVVTMAATVKEFLRGKAMPRPEIVTLDLHLDDGTLPADNVAELVAAGHKVVVLTVLPERDWVQETTEAGACAYLTKSNSLASLMTVIREVHSGNVPTTADHAFHLVHDKRPERPHLTPRELEILELVSNGMTHAAIARSLKCAASTVATHLAKVREKYNDVERPITRPTDYRDRLRERQLHRDRLEPGAEQ